MTDATDIHSTLVQNYVDKYNAKPAAKDASEVLCPSTGFAHWQGHASLELNRVDIGIYTMLGHGERFEGAEIHFVMRGGNGFSVVMDLTALQVQCLINGLAEGIHKLEQIHALGSTSEVSVTQSGDWFRYEQTTGGFVNAKTGGLAYRVFANQLDHMSTPEVMFMTYHCRGVSQTAAMPGFLTPDAADELADALKAAAYRARMMAAEQKAQGGAA